MEGTDGASSGATWAQLAVVAAVAASHMSMPNHWLPYSLVGRAHGWSLRKAVSLAALGAVGHATSTMVVVLAVFGVSSSFISHDMYNVLAAILLFLFGMYYLTTYFVYGRRDAASCCAKEKSSSDDLVTLKVDSATRDQGKQQQQVQDDTQDENVSRAAAVSVVSLTTFSPCVGSMPVVASVLTPPVALLSVVMLWATLAGTALVVMLPLVAASFLGAQHAAFARVRRHERLVLGLMLVALAAVTLFMDPHHGHDHHEHHHVANDAGVHMHHQHSKMLVKDTGCPHARHGEKENGVSATVRNEHSMLETMNAVLNGQKSQLGVPEKDEE